MGLAEHGSPELRKRVTCSNDLYFILAGEEVTACLRGCFADRKLQTEHTLLTRDIRPVTTESLNKLSGQRTYWGLVRESSEWIFLLTAKRTVSRQRTLQSQTMTSSTGSEAGGWEFNELLIVLTDHRRPCRAAAPFVLLRRRADVQWRTLQILVVCCGMASMKKVFPPPCLVRASRSAGVIISRLSSSLLLRPPFLERFIICPSPRLSSLLCGRQEVCERTSVMIPRWWGIVNSECVPYKVLQRSEDRMAPLPIVMTQRFLRKTWRPRESSASTNWFVICDLCKKQKIENNKTNKMKIKLKEEIQWNNIKIKGGHKINKTEYNVTVSFPPYPISLPSQRADSSSHCSAVGGTWV